MSPSGLRLAALLILALGVALMAFKIYADSEPGAIPLALVLLGIGLYLYARTRRRVDAR
jgi:hypothetical protein